MAANRSRTPRPLQEAGRRADARARTARLRVLDDSAPISSFRASIALSAATDSVREALPTSVTRVERDKGWTALPANERVWTYRAEGSPPPPPRLQLFPPGKVLGRGFGIIELADAEAAYRASVELPIAANQPHYLVLQARNIPTGANAALDVPPGTLVHETVHDDGSHEWDLDAPAGASTTFRATVTLRFTVKGNTLIA